MQRSEEYDSYIRTLVKEHPRSYFKTLKSKRNANVLEYIESMTPLLSGDAFLISTKVYWLLNGISEFPKCVVCGREIKRNVKINDEYPRHCCAKCLAADPSVIMHKEESYKKRYGDGITNPFQSEEVARKIDETNFRKYNARRFTQTAEFRGIMSSNSERMNMLRHETHEKNGSFNGSRAERIVECVLKRRFSDVRCQYMSERYPFSCDFYIPEIDTYIDYNGTWTHGGHPFDGNSKSDIETLERWKSKNTPYYSNAIYTWTDLDVRKRECASRNNLKRIEMWSVRELEEWLEMQVSGIEYPYNGKKLDREFEYYRNCDATELNPRVSNRNEIVKYFQQDLFFGVEKEIWRNDAEKREKLISNRIKYLGKREVELTADDILTGFKKSGIHYGYSHFNPVWFKWFIERHSVKSCYDPCGGWGHRLLGGLSLEKYIYNDLSFHTKENVDRIIEYFKIGNAVTYCEDAGKFNPKERFDAMFTCPPYFNVEKYECGSFPDRSAFERFMNHLFHVFETHSECRIFGIVIRDDLICGHADFVEKIQINAKNESYFDGTNNINQEHMFVYSKN